MITIYMAVGKKLQKDFFFTVVELKISFIEETKVYKLSVKVEK